MIDRQGIAQRWEADGSKRDERGRRVFAASEARAAGRGGLAAVSAITGLARSTIGRGLKDLDAPPLSHGRVRREGGGPRSLTDRDPTLLTALERLVAPATRGDPERPLLWVSKSLDKLACALTDMGHAISPNSVRKLLIGLGFSRQSNRKADEGSRHPDRDAQFEHINGKVVAAQDAGQPVISVDTKKKELIGNFRNGGTDYRPKGDPLRSSYQCGCPKEGGLQPRAWPGGWRQKHQRDNRLQSAGHHPPLAIPFLGPNSVFEINPRGVGLHVACHPKAARTHGFSGICRMAVPSNPDPAAKQFQPRPDLSCMAHVKPLCGTWAKRTFDVVATNVCFLVEADTKCGQAVKRTSSST